MYEKPRLERFGTFRELTMLGTDSGTDIASAFGLGANQDSNRPEFRSGS